MTTLECNQKRHGRFTRQPGRLRYVQSASNGRAFSKNALMILPALVLMAGCVTRPVSPDYPVSPRMATTFSDGEATITWNAEAEQIYTVYYTDTPFGMKADWKPLPQATRLRGNGSEITVRDRPGQDSARRYLLLSGDQTPR